MDAVERRDEVDRPIARDRVAPSVVEPGVGQPLSRRAAPQPERARARRCRSRRTSTSGTAAAIVSTAMPAPQPMSIACAPSLEHRHDAVEGGQRRPARGSCGTTAEAALDARSLPRVRTRRSRGRCRCGTTRRSASSVCIVWGSRWNIPMPNAGWSGSDEHRDRLGRHREPLDAVGVRRPRRAASPRPGCAPTPAPTARRGRWRRRAVARSIRPRAPWPAPR